MKLYLVLLTFLILASCRWTQQQAWSWFAKHKWGCGPNYTPAYAANQIQFWESFNYAKITQELIWAQKIGFSKLRVFLHVQPYIDDKVIFYKNMDMFILLSKIHNLEIIFVLFDDCWNSHYHGGKQPDPIPGVHNSQWVQCPGDQKILQSVLQGYTIQTIARYKDDTTVVMWDLYNEVGNSGHRSQSLPLLKKIFGWARSAQPSQPLTSGYWNPDLIEINPYILSQSDIITFHAYCNEKCTQEAIIEMQKHKRPVICTQFMARTAGSKFISHLPIFKKHGVWAINWGFVFGKTQTYYPWGSKEGSPVPQIWFHDVVHPDGSPFDSHQTDFIRNITKLT